MAEYIERETAKAKIREKFKFVPARIEINEVLNSIPAADAIEELTKDLERSKEWEAFWEKEANEALKKFQTTVASMPHWISVEERLPESQGPFLTRYGYGDASIETGQFFYGVLYYFYADADPHWQHESVGVEVTHWMPLPQPPKEGEA